MKYGSDYKLKNNKNTKERSSSKKKNVKKRKNRTVMKVVVILLLLIIIALIALFGYRIYQNGGGLSGTLATLLGEDRESLENLQPIQVLIMGESGVDDYKLADTIMIASYNPKTQQASLMSIPRDTYVGSRNRNTATQNYLASYKINTVYRSGTNIPEAIERINDLTGLELENYVIIDTDALVKLVDAIGGVTFNVPMDMDYDDTSQDLHIHLTEGEQLIDGNKAEQLLRFRHNNDGSTYPEEYGMEDIGRMRTQREFITATLKQTLQANNVLKLGEFLEIANENVETNMDVNVIKDYIPYAVSVDIESIRTETLPGEPKFYNGLSFYVVDEEETEALVQEMFLGISETEEGTEGESATQLKIEVLNGSGDSDKLSEVTELLNNSGYNVTKTGEVSSTARTTIINRTNISEERANGLKETLGLGNMTVGENNSNVDFTIIIGRDY